MSSMAYPMPARSNRAGVFERASEQWAARVQRHLQFVCRGFATTPSVVELPALRRREHPDVPLAELAGACAAVRGLVEPDRALQRVERECRGRFRTASGSGALTLH